MDNMLSMITREVDTATSQLSGLFSGGVGDSLPLPGGSNQIIYLLIGLFLFRYLSPVIFPLFSTFSFALASITGTLCFFVRMTIGLINEYFKMAGFYLFRFASRPLAVNTVLVVTLFAIGVLVGMGGGHFDLPKPAKGKAVQVTDDIHNIIGTF